MNTELLPIGTIVKIKKYLVIITGYSLNKKGVFSGTYKITPYPFSCNNIKISYQLLEKYDWFYHNSNSIKNKNISEVVSLGYINKDFEILKEKVKR